MDQVDMDMNRQLMLDGNAVAGALYEIFGTEMTTSLTECAYCSKRGDLGTLFAFVQAPGIVLRCPACENIILRVVRTPQEIYLDARGAVFLRLELQKL